MYQNKKKLVIVSFIIEELLYFFDWIDFNTTLIVVSKPPNDQLENLFIEYCSKAECTTIYINEDYTKNASLSNRTQKIITGIITDGFYDMIITHPDSNNLLINKNINKLIKELMIDSHYTYQINNSLNNNSPVKKLRDYQIYYMNKYAHVLSIKIKSCNNDKCTLDKFLKTECSSCRPQVFMYNDKQSHNQILNNFISTAQHVQSNLIKI